MTATNPAKIPGTRRYSNTGAPYWVLVEKSMIGKRTGRTVQVVGISAASHITGVEVHTLRYWEREFEPYLNPVRTQGGQRRYRPEDIQTVFIIKRLLRDEMFSIAGAKRHLSKSFQAAA